MRRCVTHPYKIFLWPIYTLTRTKSQAHSNRKTEYTAIRTYSYISCH